MRQFRSRCHPVAALVSLVAVTMAFAARWPSPVAIASPAGSNVCEPTVPNGSTPPGERPSRNHHGGPGLWADLPPEGTVTFRPGGPGFVLRDGSLQMKFGWWRAVVAPLTIEGHRLDAVAPPLRAQIPTGYSHSFQATGLTFPTAGCWEVTGRAGEATLTFVVNVVKIGEGPVPNAVADAPPNQRLQPTAPELNPSAPRLNRGRWADRFTG